MTEELLANVTLIATAVTAGIFGYFSKPRLEPKVDSSLTAIGAEFGNKMQMDEVITELRRIGDILENKKQSELKEQLRELKEMIKDHDR